MKILVFTSLYPNNVWPNHGVFIKERMTCVGKLFDCEIKVVAPVPYFPSWFKRNWRWKFSQIARKELRDAVEVYHPRYLMTPKLGMALYGFLMFVSVLGTVVRIRRSFDFDLIDAHYIYPDGFAAILLGIVLGRPVVVSARGSDINQYADFPMVRQLLRYTMRKSAKIIAVCQALKNAIISLGIAAENIVVIPNGVNLGKFYPVPREEARQRLGLPMDKKIVLSVGNLIPRKGFDLAIAALKLIRAASDRDRHHLVIVGDGPSREDLTKLARASGQADAVTFAGAIPHRDLYLWYSAADCSLLASSREGWPNVLLESMACGTPVVATDIWGTPEVIDSGAVGILTRRDEYAIAEGVSVALRKRWTADEILAHASGYSWMRAATAVRKVFESALTNKSRPELTKNRKCGKAAA